jgi:hypothetical protein
MNMPPKVGLTKQSDFEDVHVRELDFVSRFSMNWDALKNILGIVRPIEKEPGSILRSYTTVAKNGLAESVGEGEEIPYTEFEVTETLKDDITIDKYSKATSIESVSKYGAAIAIQKTDDQFLVELQNKVLDEFYTFLKTGTLTGSEDNFQMALAMARGKVIDKFNKMSKSASEIVGFVNVLDVFKYLGNASVTIQTQFGLQYIKDFMGYSTLFLLSAPNIPEGTVIATAVENIDLYYVNPANSDFAKLGLTYTTDGETNLIGFHANGNYSTAVGEVFALMGMKLWAEYLDAIAVITFGSSPEPSPSITLDKSTASVDVGSTVTITATTVPEDAEVTWTSSDTTVATVSDGVVTGVANGDATITATNSTASATCTVVVGTGA